MNNKELLQKIQENPKSVSFSDCLEVIDSTYSFKPTAFRNGDTYNEAGQNNGSCKIFFFAKKHGLTEEQTLNCFGTYYRNDVLNNPDGIDHQNIRNFMKYGWQGIEFEGEALS